MKKLGKIWSDYSFIFVLIAIFIVYAITSSGLTWSGVMNIFRHSAVIGTVALGMGLICLTGEIDLSVGSMLALTSGLSVIVFNMTGSILLTLLFALAFGALCGFVNGVLVGGVLRICERRAGRRRADAGIHCHTGNDADLPLLCPVFLPSCGPCADRRRQQRL